MQTFVIKLTEQQLDVIAGALQTAPWRLANPVIGELQKQVAQQIDTQMNPLTGLAQAPVAQHAGNGVDQQPSAGV